MAQGGVNYDERSGSLLFRPQTSRRQTTTSPRSGNCDNTVHMAKQPTDKADKQKRRPGPPPSGVGTLIGVRIQPDDLVRLDHWRNEQPDKPGRPEAIRRLVELGLDKN